MWWLYFYILILLVVVLFYLLILKPLVPLVFLKLKLGKQAKIKFFPFLGFLYFQQKSKTEFGDNQEYIRERFILTNFLIYPQLMIFDAKDFKYIALNHHEFNTLQVTLDNRILDQGLLGTKGKKWKEQRKLLGQSFHYDQLQKRVPWINQIVLEKIQNQWKDGNFDAVHEIATITGKVVVQTFFGNDLNQVDGEKYAVSTIEAFKDTLSVAKSPYFLAKLFLLGQNAWKIFPTKQEKQVYDKFTDLREIAKGIIDKRIQNNMACTNEDDKNKNDSDFLDSYLKRYLSENNLKDKEMEITREEIVQQFLTLFIAGTDTTAHLVALVLYFCGVYQESQEELYQEIIGVLKDGELKQNQLNQFKLMEAFINECLRFRNIAPGIQTRIVTKDQYLNGVYLNKGMLLFYQSKFNSFNEKYYDDPYTFNYKRWLDQNPIKDKENSSFIFTPFSAGGRNCIGQHLAQIETTIILCHLLKAFHITLDEEKNKKLIWNMDPLFTFFPQDVIIIQRRK